MSVFTTGNRIATFQRKLEFWKTFVEGRQYECFPTPNEFLIENILEETIHDSIFRHLNGLQQAFRNISHLLLMSLSVSEIHIVFQRDHNCMSVQNYECLIEITSDSSLKEKFNEVPLAEFWCSLLQEYLQVTKCAVLKILPFPTTYLREAGFKFMREQNRNTVTEWMSHTT